MAKTRKGLPNGGARPGGGRKPKPTDPITWSGLWQRIDSELAPAAFAKLLALVEQGDKEAVFFALKMAGFIRPYEAAVATLTGSEPRARSGVWVTFSDAPLPGSSVSTASFHSSHTSEPSPTPSSSTDGSSRP